MRKLARILMTKELFTALVGPALPKGADVRDVRMTMADDMSNLEVSIIVASDSIGKEVGEGEAIPLFHGVFKGGTTEFTEVKP